jgi:hypothetical protein
MRDESPPQTSRNSVMDREDIPAGRTIEAGDISLIDRDSEIFPYFFGRVTKSKTSTHATSVRE